MQDVNNKIKINFVDGADNYGRYLIENWLNKKGILFEISKNPDYLFYGPHGFDCLKFDCIKIFITGEDVSPDFNICDYAIGFDYINFGDRYLRYPLFLSYLDDLNRVCIPRGDDFIQKRISEANSFCSYTVSNSNADKIRDWFFTELSKYKKIDSGGKHLNNIGYKISSKYEFDKKHKFSIAFENASHIGYTTEKILQAFAAGCIPIYWGDPCIDNYFNKNSFIYFNGSNFEDVINKIKHIDNNQES